MVRLTGPLDVPYANVRNTKRVIEPALDQTGAQLTAVADAVGSILNTARDQQIENQVASAELRTQKQLDDLRVEIENAPASDGEDYVGRWQQRADEIVQQNAENLRSPAHQRLWQQRMGERLVRERGGIVQLQQRRMVESARAGVLDVLGQSEAVFKDEATTAEARAQALTIGEMAIRRAEERRVLGADDAERLRNTLREQETTSRQNAASREIMRQAEVNPYPVRDMLRAAIENPNEAPPDILRDVPLSDRLSILHSTEAEINRREAEARARRSEATAALRDTVAAQNQLLQRGIMPSGGVLDVNQLSAVLGPDVAQNYLANLAGAAAAQGMADLPIGDVARVASGAPANGASDAQNIVTVEARNAAQAMLRERGEDPGGYALQRGLMPQPNLLPTLGAAIQSGQWQEAGQALQQRSTAAVSLRDRGVVQSIAPLSRSEAQALSQALGSMSTQQRLQFYAQAYQNMNPEAYTAMMGQVSANAPVTAFAGFLWSNPAGTAQDTRAAAQRLLRGQELLRGPADANGRRGATIQMPSEAEMREAFADVVGDAYAHVRGAARPGEPSPADQAFEVFNAYYAALSEESGEAGNNVNGDRARRAAALASGGVTQWGPRSRETLMPWGMTRSEFEAGVRAGFERIGQRGVNPRNYELRSMGGGVYQVFEGNNRPARNAAGGPLEIRVVRQQTDQQ